MKSPSLLPNIKPQQESKRIKTFIKKTFKTAKRKSAVLTLSGGVDSSTTLTLAAQALSPAQIMVLKLPYHSSHPQSISNADLAIKHNKIPKRNVFEVNIGPSVDRIWKTILIKCSPSQTGQSKIANQIRLGNIMTRVRMIYAFDMARARVGLAIGTENKSENLLGYFTRFGDEASDLEPLKHLYKTQVFALAQHLELPEEILQSPPTAGLWAEQTDQEELEFTYSTADQVLYLHSEKKMSPIQIAKKLLNSTREKTETYWKRRVSKVLERVKKSDFKHYVPYSL